MERPEKQVDWAYGSLLLIWSFLFASHFLLLFSVLVLNPELFLFDRSKPFVGEHYLIVPLAILFGLEELIVSYFRRSRYLKQAISEQKPELVQTALIIPVSSCISVSLAGLFLAWWFEYSYFYIWFMAGIFGTLFCFPRKSDLAAAGHTQPG